MAVSKNQLDSLNIKFSRFEGINGKNLEKFENSSIDLKKYVGIEELKLKISELKASNYSYQQIGCWLSHLKLHYKIMKQKEAKMTLILEDDFIADGSVTSKIKNALEKLPDDWDILYVGHCDRKNKCNAYLDYDENICLTRREVFCATGYLIRNREVARILFEKGNNIKPLVADRYFHKAGLNIYLIFPHLFKQRKNIDADIKSPGGYFSFLSNDTFEKSLSNIGKKTRNAKILK